MTEESLHQALNRKIITKTWLNRKPSASSFLVMMGSLLIMTLFSQVYWSNLFNLSDQLPAVNTRIFQKHEWWRIYTAIFIHADFKHYLSNMYMLSILSFFVYGYFGKWLYPFWTIAISGPVNAIAVYTYPPEVRLLGASGLVYVLGGLWLTLFIFLQRQHSLTGRLIRAIGMGSIVFFPSTFEPSVSYRTHFFGFVAGILLGVIYYFHSGKNLHQFEEYRIEIDDEQLSDSTGKSNNFN